MSKDDRAPLWKQLLGAVIGCSLALVIYSAYKFTGPKVTAWLYTPQSYVETTSDEAVRLAETDLEEGEVARMNRRHAQIAKTYAKPGSKAAADVAPVDAEKDPWGATVKEWEKLEADLLGEPEPAPTVEPAPPPPPPVKLPADSKPIESSDQLPDSGIGTWIAALIALCGASGLLYRRKIAEANC